ncbi:MAG TPA: DUF3084 domain-containing protein [Armatimonadota bacterium]|nr:DUF3084 domain-containing protein [Armatimonadota bacterium]
MGSMIFLALIIILVSGLIAYVGDWVGRKMGRKRLTLMGLRPRHTAIVISVTVGMLIAILTLIATLAVNRGIREAFFTPLDKLKAELISQRNAVQSTRTELAEARRQTAEAKALFMSQTAQLSKTGNMLKISGEQRKQIERQLGQARGQLADVQKRLDDNKHQLNGKRAELTRIQAEFARVSQDLHASQDQMKSAQSTLISLNAQIRKLENDKLALEDAVGWWNERVKVLSEFARSSFTPLSLAYGQEILTGLIPKTASSADVKEFITQFLTVAESVVRQRSVELPKDAAALIFIAGDKDNITNISRTEAIDLLAKRCDSVHGDDGIIMRLTPVNNVPVNGPAFIAVDRVELLPCSQVFLAGNVVAKVDTVITAETTQADLLGKLADSLLREQLPATLRAKGMLSIARRFDADHPNLTPETAIPLVSWADLMAASNKALHCRGTVSLIARAHSAVTNYGPLDIDLDVVPEP